MNTALRTFACFLLICSVAACQGIADRLAPELALTDNPYENVVRGTHAHRSANDLIRALYAKCLATGKSQDYCQIRYRPAAKYTRAMLAGLRNVTAELAILDALTPEQTQQIDIKLRKAQGSYWFALGALMHLTGSVDVPIDWGDGEPVVPSELLEQAP